MQTEKQLKTKTQLIQGKLYKPDCRLLAYHPSRQPVSFDISDIMLCIKTFDINKGYYNTVLIRGEIYSIPYFEVCSYLFTEIEIK
jgi:hypothetical protein